MGRSAFVARTRELEQLSRYLDCGLEGQGQVAFIMGEAGAGKTALITEFARRAEETNADLVVAIGNCNAQTGIGDPYLPFREILGQLTGDVDAKLAQGAITAENARRLRGLVRWSCDALVEFGPDLINVLVPGTALLAKAGRFVAEQAGWTDKLKQFVEGKAAEPAGAALDQSRIFEQTTDVLKALASKSPLVLALDDLQWADSASISLLFHLSRRIGESRILVLGAYRPEEVKLGRGGERHPLEKVLAECKRYLGDICVDLNQTEQEEARQFVDALLDLEPNRLGPSFRNSLVQHTGGHPLFAVELLREMQERGDLERDAEGCWVEHTGLDWDALPPRVEGVIEERIGRLEAELQETLTVGSVEGEQFTAEVIARVRAVDERGLVRRLSQELDRQHHLVASQGIRRLGQQPMSSYRFRHNLFQKYLYEGLDAAERAYLHQDVGVVLEALYGEQSAEIALQLARHFQEAGLADRAIHYLGLAAEQAMRVSANTEAIDHLAKALTLLQALPATPERDQMELPLQMALGTAAIVARGWSAPPVRTALDRALELCRNAESTPQLFPVLRSLYTHYNALGQHRTGRELAGQLLELAQRDQDPASLLMAYQALGQNQAEVGEFAAARHTLERGLTYHDPEQYRSLAFLYGEEHGVSCRLNLMVTLFALGYPDLALAHVREAVALAESLAHPHVLAYALYGVSCAHLWRGETREGAAYAREAIDLCNRKRIPFWWAAASFNHGYVRAKQGHLREGIEEASRGLASYRSLGANVFQTLYLALLADLHLLAGQVGDGLAAVTEGLAAANATGERCVEAELYRLRADLLRAQGRDADVEVDLQRALAVARGQQARFWELRATTSLCRLWRDQGKRVEARRMLAGVYDWFTEGFDTADLREARALLEELAGM